MRYERSMMMMMVMSSSVSSSSPASMMMVMVSPASSPSRPADPWPKHGWATDKVVFYEDRRPHHARHHTSIHAHPHSHSHASAGTHPHGAAAHQETHPQYIYINRTMWPRFKPDLQTVNNGPMTSGRLCFDSLFINQMISQIFILSARGDTIINRDFRSDLIKNTPELFFRNVKLYKGDAPPLFNLQGINFAYLKKSSLFIVATSRFNVSPSYILELLNRIFVIIKDFLGIVTEEMVRKNFVLVYEILDEIIDFGQPQLTSTELIKPLIVNELVQNKQSLLSMSKLGGSFSLFSPDTISSQASKVAVGKNKEHEIFVDVYEKISMIFNASGYVINSSIDGCIQMKSYLHGNPPLKLMLNDDVVMAGSANTVGGKVVLDDYNFHESVNYSDFELNKALKITPPEGEFIVMNYRVTTDFNAPFRVHAYFEESNPYKLEFVVKLKATFAKEITATFVDVKFTVPKNASSVGTQIIKNQGNQRAEFKESNRAVEWNIKKMTGGSEYTLVSKISLPQAAVHQAQKETGAINLSFEIPMLSLSGLQIKFLKVLQEGDSPAPKKWVRYLTKSSSYVCRI